MLISVKNKFVADIPTLNGLVLQYVYDKENMSADNQRLMEDSVVAWNKKIFKDPDIQYGIERIGWMLYHDGKGKFDRRKELFKKHDIDWTKAHRGVGTIFPKEVMRD